MRGLHAFEHLYADFDQVTRLMRRLVNVYSGYGSYFQRNYRGYGFNHGYDSRNEDEYQYGTEDDYDDDEYDEDYEDYGDDYED